MLSLKKIWELVQGTTLDDAHEIPVSEGVGAGKTKKYNIGQLKAFISSYILQQISGITKGDQGPQGATGAQGIQGEKGEKGDKGDKGEQGLKGDQGLQGPIGIQGPIGVKGDKGDTGAQGVQGIKGDKGDKGDQGDAGLNGDNGNDGISAYEVAVNNGFVGTEADWLESLKGEKGDQGDAGEQGPQGEQGEAGANGADGATGAPGVGVPTGGTTGQVLKKSSNTNYATEWGDAASDFSNLGGDPHDNTLLDAELDRIEAIADEAITNIGDLDNLQTTDKTNIVSALNEVETDISNSSQDQITLRIFKVSNYGTL